MKTHLDIYINFDYHGVRNRIPTEKEIVGGWYSCLEFFKEREAYLQKSAGWCINYSREMESKAGQTNQYMRTHQS